MTRQIGFGTRFEYVALGLVVTLCGACSGPRQVANTNPHVLPPKKKGPVKTAPKWVMKTPSIKDKVCAVGAVDPTFYRDDGRRNASEAARNELARTVQVKISTVMYDEVNSHGGGFTDEVSIQQIVGSISDVVLSGAQVVEIWFDEHGVVDRDGMTYALACMPKDASMKEFAEKLEAAAATQESPDKEKRIQRVKENARKAFDELEAMEAR